MNYVKQQPTSFLIAQAARYVRAVFNNAFQESGVSITTDQWGILKCLWKKENITQSEIAEAVSKDKASVTRILDIMQKNGLIERCHDDLDRRSYRIFLTGKGKDLESELKPVISAARQRIYRNLNEQDLQELRKLLLTLIKKTE